MKKQTLPSISASLIFAAGMAMSQAGIADEATDGSTSSAEAKSQYWDSRAERVETRFNNKAERTEEHLASKAERRANHYDKAIDKAEANGNAQLAERLITRADKVDTHYANKSERHSNYQESKGARISERMEKRAAFIEANR